MRYFTWQEPYTLTPGSRLFANATFTASEECLLEYYRDKLPIHMPDSFVIKQFKLINNAWETDEHGKKL